MIKGIRGIRKRWFVVAVSVALLAVGLTFGSVFAANSRIGDPTGYGPSFDHPSGVRHGNSDTWFNRVAEILGVERTALDDAMATASDERANARFEGYVQGLVDDETLTGDEASAANNWFDTRPGNSGPLALRLAGTSDAERVDNMLAKLVEKEKLTQDESDALDAWHGNRPDSLPEVSRRHHHRGDDGHANKRDKDRRGSR